jgi:hypothetical protein
MMDYRNSPTFFDDEFVPLWGDINSNVNLPIVNRGPFDTDISFYGETGVQSIGVWDWMDHHKQMNERRGDDFAFLMISHGNQDNTIDWETQGEPSIEAMNAAQVGYSAVTDNRGHSWAGFDAVITSLFEVGLGDWTYPVDLSFPAIQRAASERVERQEPPPEGGLYIADYYNLDFEWATERNLIGLPIVDTQDRYEITIVSTSTEKTVDITPRRTQAFRRNTGDECSWTATDLNNDNVTSGGVTVDEDSLVTVEDVSVTTGLGTRLVIFDCL